MTTSSLAYRVREAASSVRGRLSVVPRVGIILGSGLGPLADEVENPTVVPYAEIPHFAVSTVSGHAGQLVGGTLEGVPVAVLRGRVHFYEGYSLQQITFPIRTLHRLGAEILIITNAAGGLNPVYRPGDLMALRDHINLPGLAGMNPLVGADEPELGVRFLDMTDQYDGALRARALALGAELGVPIHEGVYVVVAGPSFETRAELRFLRQIGADAVGMSTVPEVIVARHERMRVLGISVITNSADPDAVVADVSHEGVLSVAERAASGLAAIVRGILRELDGDPPDAEA
ncbi:MAG TPA: purine-nucleoside phosphorylase [Chloroflexota bacterium]|nr:purine-nucleoside phosphorylase [Chloroflexota bacterium]